MERLSSLESASFPDLAIHMARFAVTKPFLPNRSVLDIGCGEGFGTRLYKHWGAQEVLGVDISSEAIKEAQRFKVDGVSYQVRDACKLENEISQYNLVVCLETIEHLEDPEKLLRNLKKQLSTQSTLVISCPNDSWYYKYEGENHFHKNSWTYYEFKKLLNNYFLNIEWLVGFPMLGFVNTPGEHGALPSFSRPTTFQGERIGHLSDIECDESAYYVAVINSKIEYESVGAFSIGMSDYFGDKTRSYKYPGELQTQLNQISKRMFEQDELIESLTKKEEMYSASRVHKESSSKRNIALEAEVFDSLINLIETCPNNENQALLSSSTTMLEKREDTKFARRPSLINLIKEMKPRLQIKQIILVQLYRIYRRMPSMVRPRIKPASRVIKRLLDN